MWVSAFQQPSRLFERQRSSNQRPHLQRLFSPSSCLCVCVCVCGLISDAWWSFQSICRLGAHQFVLTLLSLLLFIFFPPFSSPAWSNPAKVPSVSWDVDAAHFLLLSTRLTDPLGSLCWHQSDIIGTVCVICAFPWENVLYTCVKYWHKRESLLFFIFAFSWGNPRKTNFQMKQCFYFASFHDVSPLFKR